MHSSLRLILVDKFNYTRLLSLIFPTWSVSVRCACEPLPVLHTVGLPALGQLQGADRRLPPGSNVIIAGVPVEVSTEATHLVLQSLAHGDAESVEAVVPNLNVLRCVDDDEAFGRGQTCHQPCEKRHRHRRTVDLRRR